MNYNTNEVNITVFCETKVYTKLQLISDRSIVVQSKLKFKVNKNVNE